MKKIFIAFLFLMTCLSLCAIEAPDTLRQHYFMLIERALDDNDSDVYRLLDEFKTQFGNTADAMVLQAMSDYADGNPEQGASLLSLSLENVTNNDILNRAVIYLVMAGKADNVLDALNLTNMAIKENPKFAKAYYVKARIFYDSQDLMSEAERNIKKAIKYSEGDITYRTLLVKILIMQDKYDKALKEVNGILNVNDNYPAAYYLRSYLMKVKGKTEPQIDDYLVYLQLTHDVDVSDIMDELDTHYDYMMDFAKKILKNAISNDSRAYWHYFISLMKYNTDDPSYMEDVDKALSIVEDDDVRCRLLLNKSISFSQKENIDSALWALNEVIGHVEGKGDKAAYWLYRSRALYLKDLKRYGEADSSYTTSLSCTIKDSADRAEVFYERSKLRYDYLNDTVGTMADRDSALAYAPNSCHILYGHGRLLRKMGDEARANADFLRILDLDSVTTANSYRHFALANLGRRAEAEQWLDSMLKNPENERVKFYVLYNAACMYSIMNDAPTAMRYLMDVMALRSIECEQISKDEDFENIRQTPEFQSLLKVSCAE